jgi:hypothetical protein
MSVERLLNVANVSSVVSAINVTDVFTDDFDVYKIVSGNLLGNNSTATGVNLRLINAGGSVIADNYQYAQRVMKSETDNGNNKSTDESRIWNFFNGVDDSGRSQGSHGYIFSPTDTSSWTYVQWHSMGINGSQKSRSYIGVATYPYLDKITGFQVELNESASELAAGGTIKTYGIRSD